MSENNCVNVTIITNTFEPTDNPICETIPFVHGRTLTGYLGNLRGEYVVALNGGIVEAKEYSLIYVQNEDHIVVSPVPQGGGGSGKNILRLVAVVALTYFTMGAGAAWAGAIGATGAAATATYIGAFIGGTLLINSLLPPAEPGTPSSPKSYKDSPTYGIDGAKNTSTEGIPVPVVYGEYRMAGNIIGMSSENVNDTQYLYMLLNAGEGEIAGISSILVNDQPLNNFSEISTHIKTGTANQKNIGWFGEITRPNSLGSNVSEQWTTYTTKDEVDKLRLDFVFPRGLTRINKKSGSRLEHSVSLEFEYRMYVTGQPDDIGWLRLPWVTSNGGVTTGEYKITDKTQAVLRRSVKSDLLPEQRYDVRFRRIGKQSDDNLISDEVSITDVNEILVEKVCYKNTALLAIRVKLTDQLSNQPQISFINQGIKIKVWDFKRQKWIRTNSTNPAWIIYDLLTNKRYGAGLPESMIKLEHYKEWAKWCDDQDLTFNGVFDTEGNVFDGMQAVFRAGHAKLVSIGTKISVAVEKPSRPVMMFSSANTIKDTFSIDWLTTADRANEIEITYFDSKAGNKQRNIKVYDEDAITRGEPQKPSSMTLIGCVDEEKAFYEGLLALNINRYISQTVSFDAPIEALACTIGSVVYVQNDMPQWGYSGRLAAAPSTNKITLDYDIVKAMEGVEPNIVLLHSSANMRYSGSINFIRRGNIIRVAGTVDAEVSRAIIGGNDYAILSVNSVGANTEIEVDSNRALHSGEQVELWDTDVIEERTIIDINGANIIVDRPFSFKPTQYMSYMIGQINKMKKLFRITGIDYNTEHVRTIRAIEYNESIYDKNIPFSASEIESGLGLLRETDLSNISETLVRIGDNLRPKVKLDYANISGRYKTTEVYVATNEHPYELIGDHQYTISFESEDNAKLRIKLVAVDSTGASMGVKSVVEHKYTVLGKLAPPQDVENLTLEREVGGVKLKWDANNELDLSGYEIRQGQSWDDGMILSERYGGTMLFVPISEPGEYRFMVRALDTSGNKSVNVASVNIGLVRPKAVRNFITVQHSDTIRFQWDRPDDRTVNKFYIREGRSWNESILLASASGTKFETPVNVSGDRSFFIKAVDLVGLESAEEVFSTTNVARLQDRNMIYTTYHGLGEDGIEISAPGVKLNCSGSYPVLMDDNVLFAEYTASIKLPYKARARNALGLQVGSLVKDSMTWDDADFAWASSSAKIPWASSGDPDMVVFRPFIALKLDDGVKDWKPKDTHRHFSLNETLIDGVDNIKPLSSRSVEYGIARRDKGVHLNPFTRVNWPADIKKTDYSFVFWAMIDSSKALRRESGYAWYAKTDRGDMVLYYDKKQGAIYLRETDNPTVVINHFRPSPGDVALIGISQKGANRTLRIGLADGRMLTASATMNASTTITSYGIGSPN
ncbi:MAG: host specificity factor TipJ family phage tail protein [Vibrio splendidus]